MFSDYALLLALDGAALYDMTVNDLHDVLRRHHRYAPAALRAPPPLSSELSNLIE